MIKTILVLLLILGITLGVKAQDETVNGNLTVNGGVSGTSKKIIFKTSDNGDLSKYIGTESYWTIIGANGNEGWKFKDNTGDILMQINGKGNNNGYIGIGTTIPQYTIDIDGNFQRGSGIKHVVRLTHKNALDAGDGTSLLFTNRGHSANDYGGYIALVSNGSNPNWLNPRLDFAVQNPNTHQLSDISTKMTILGNGNVGIGINNPDSKLVVDGKIRSEEVKVEIIDGPDYVFEPDYELRTLQETKEFITTNKHLPEIPSANEMEANGIDLGDMNMRLLKKIEELTLYQIELMEEMEAMKKELQELKNNEYNKH